jgi:hypothetical protein
MKRCHQCGREWISDRKRPGFKEYCEACSAYLHCCLNCRFHDRTAHNQCFIPTTDWVADKAGPNFCDDFEFSELERRQTPDEKARSSHTVLDSLFGGPEQSADSDRLGDFRKLLGD